MRSRYGTEDWLITDHLGSGVVWLTKTGAPYRETVYTPFGKIHAQDSTGIRPPWLFAGHRRLEFSGGYVYMKARWYNPDTGTFLSVDPVVADAWDPQAYNAYSYARNNPVSFTDPTGMSPHDWIFPCGVGCTMLGPGGFFSSSGYSTVIHVGGEGNLTPYRVPSSAVEMLSKSENFGGVTSSYQPGIFGIFSVGPQDHPSLAASGAAGAFAGGRAGAPFGPWVAAAGAAAGAVLGTGVFVGGMYLAQNYGEEGADGESEVEESEVDPPSLPRRIDPSDTVETVEHPSTPPVAPDPNDQKPNTFFEKAVFIASGIARVSPTSSSREVTFVERLRKLLVGLLHLPFMVRAFSRLADATSQQDWVMVASTIEELHAKGFDSDDTHHRLGCAYAMLEKWPEAAHEFEAIKSDLPKPRENARRFFNYALALAMAGRKAESLGVLQSASAVESFSVLRAKSDQLMEHLRDGNVPPPGVQ